MAEKKTVKELMELQNDINDLQSDEPGRYPTEAEVEKGANEMSHIDLTKDAKPWEIVEALGVTRVEISMALEKVYGLIDNLSDEIDRLRMHRHDTSKTYSGRPEM